MKTIRLREGRERSLLRRHPWVFEGSVDRGKADAGETVRVEAADGRFLAWGAYSPASLYRVRAWSFDEAERIDRAFFQRRIAIGITRRTAGCQAGMAAKPSSTSQSTTRPGRARAASVTAGSMWITSPSDEVLTIRRRSGRIRPAPLRGSGTSA